MKRLALALLVLAACDENAQRDLIVRWTVAGEVADVGCASVGATQVSVTADDEGNLTDCASGVMVAREKTELGRYQIVARLWRPAVDDPELSDLLDSVSMSYQWTGEPIFIDFLPVALPDAGVPDASDPDAGAADASVDAMPDAGPAGPDRYFCYCNSDGAQLIGCADVAGCMDSQPVPGTLCTDYCAAHGGLGTSYCFNDHVDCM
jgi:hypothetical protein